jgi:hypothetical protein
LSGAAMAEDDGARGAGFFKIVQSSIAKIAAPGFPSADGISTVGSRQRRGCYRRIFCLSRPSCKAKPYPHINDARAASGRASGGEPRVEHDICWPVPGPRRK